MHLLFYHRSAPQPFTTWLHACHTAHCNNLTSYNLIIYSSSFPVPVCPSPHQPTSCRGICYNWALIIYLLCTLWQALREGISEKKRGERKYPNLIIWSAPRVINHLIIHIVTHWDNLVSP
jgi:hypothetical protein